jgi:signal transduction histidine kinase/DNA-binding response OmpR family regulator/ligand-binding sensor domain-containing protein
MKLFTLFLFLLLFVQARSQEHIVFSPINSIHGLSDNRVRTICQLNDGRMVIITEGLVNIYDGASFHYMHYNEQEEYYLKDYSSYHRAYVDNENRLWIKNQHNLMLFNINTERFASNIDSTLTSLGITNRVSNLFVDTNFNLWFVTDKNELFIREGQTLKTRIYLTNIHKISSIDNDRLYDLATIDKQVFLFFKSGEMVCYNTETGKELYRENQFKGKDNCYSSTLMVVPYKHYLYQARDGINIGQLVRFNTLNRNWERILETDYWMNTLTIDSQGTCWISSLRGLWKIDRELQNKQLLSPPHLVDGDNFESEINTQFNDNQGGLWVGTVNRGLFYYHPDRFKFRNYGSSLFNLSKPQNICVFGITNYNKDVIVTTQAGLFKYQTNNSNLERLNNIPTDLYYLMLFTDSKNRLWVGTFNNGLYCINNNKTTHYKQPSHCINIYEAFDGRLFLCTNEGPGLFDPETGSFDKAKGDNLTYTHQLTAYKQDTLLGCCDEGLFFYNMASNTVSIAPKNAPVRQHKNQHYHCLYTDNRSLIWIGTLDGLIVFNPKTSTTRSFYSEDGLVNNSIRSVIEDNNGNIWVSTSNGISRIELIPDESSYHFRFTNYNRSNGLTETEFLPRSVCKTKDGRLLWGGLDGFNEIDLNRMNKPEPQLYTPLFTRFLLAGTEIKMGESYDANIILKQSITTTKQIRLKHHQNFFSVEFSALNYVNPAQTDFRYLLEGIDTEWRYINTSDGIGRAGYTNLSPGIYRLKVQTTNNQQWNGHVAELTIEITPPFWKTIWAYMAYLILLASFVYVVISYTIRHNIQKNQQRHKEELDQMKFTFFTNISHELRTPLTLIITPLDSLIKKLTDEPLKKQLSGISHNAHELLNLVNQLLAFRKLEIKGETLSLSYCNVGEWMENLVTPFKILANENELHFEYIRPATDIFLYVDQDKLQKIVNNLLSNAFKFTPKEGHIQLKIFKDDTAQQLSIIVSDTGCGIAPNEQVHIFDRFYQAQNQQNQTGSGIGLHLVKEYTELHNGTVNVNSRLGEGSVFTVTLAANLKPQTSTDDPEVNVNINNQKILVIEDHKEFRSFLFSELSLKYKVILAADGKEGLQKAHVEQPDLIVSDVMMPVMSGTEFCRQLKSDLNISHIPVILLTAKISDEAQIEGFEAGAEAYISKPFNMEILLLRIDNLLEQQAKRKELFKKNIVITPASLAISNVDEELIRKVLSHITANLENGSYSVDQLSKDMYMDRSGLYRKLTAITGQTPTEFIRSVRLKKAAQMLINGYSVSDVAVNVGFGSSSYFTKCFHEEYGVKPSQYKNSHNNT